MRLIQNIYHVTTNTYRIKNKWKYQQLPSILLTSTTSALHDVSFSQDYARSRQSRQNLVNHSVKSMHGASFSQDYTWCIIQSTLHMVYHSSRPYMMYHSVNIIHAVSFNQERGWCIIQSWPCILYHSVKTFHSLTTLGGLDVEVCANLWLVIVQHRGAVVPPALAGCHNVVQCHTTGPVAAELQALSQVQIWLNFG